jgi:hypothetical protein
MGVPAVGAKSPYPTDDRGQAGKDLPHIIRYQGVDIGAVRGQIKRLLLCQPRAIKDACCGS